MSENRVAFLATPAGIRIDGRVIAFVFFLAVPVFEVALISFVGPGAPALNQETVLVGP